MEKGLINGGVYVFKPTIFTPYSLPDKFSLEKDFLEPLVSQLYMAAYISNGYFIDIGVKHPNTNSFILGIECDGATYHSSKSARDRDRLRQEILESKGWKIHRIWSTDWFKNRDHEIERLLNKIMRIVEETCRTEKQASDKDMKADEHNESEVIFEDVRSDKKLRNILDDYRRIKILIKYPNMNDSILRDEMIDAFIAVKPTTLEEFHQRIPLKLREKTDKKQMEFIDDIFEILEEYEQ